MEKTSVVVILDRFFGQLALGIFADPIFLMTGKLHLPIPAVILAGPLYRFEGLFMPILFISTLLLSGPAWCSQLCYFGAFDAWSAGENWNEKGSPITSKCDTAYYFWLCWGHPTPNIRSERQDSHRFWNSGRSYRPTYHAIVFQKETEDGALQ